MNEKANYTILAECVQRFDRLDEKLDMLIDRSDRIDSRYEKHIETSTAYREKVERHDHLLSLIEKEKLNTLKASQWRIGIIVGCIVGIVTTAARILWK
jgi:hypothetical protein